MKVEKVRFILPDRILITGDNDVVNLIASDRVSIENTDKTVKCMMGIGGENAVAMFGNDSKKHYVGIQLEPDPQVVINKAVSGKSYPITPNLMFYAFGTFTRSF